MALLHQRMGSIDQRMDSIGQRLASVATAPAAAAGGGGPPDPRRKAAALQRRMATGRERADHADPALASALSLAQQTLSRREQLKGLKDQSRDLESQLAEALSIQLRKESKHKLTTESISSTTAMNERLSNSVLQLRNKRDERTAVISDELKGLETLEAKSNEDATLRENIEKVVSWYDRFLGFQVFGGSGGEGVKFVFNKIDPRSVEKEYSFCMKYHNDRFNLLRCDPHIKEIEELVKELNLTGDLFKFVRTVREKFQTSSMNGVIPVSSSVCPEVPSVPFSPPVTTPVNSRSSGTPNQGHSGSKNNRQSVPAKRRAAASPGPAASSLRRSPRF